MPRQPRCRHAPGSLEPGRLYHVTNRGVDRCDIFASALDRIIFLSMFAEACCVYGAVCHAWCLMTTHFHLVVEDTNGVLSQVMHRAESAYARYFNDTRRRRRAGPLFEGRFRAKLVDSTDYFDAACAYVLLNPVETEVPMVVSAEAYPWSSAALVCSALTPAASIALLLDLLGGIDAILSALPPSSRRTSRELRRARLEALASGAWLDRDHLLSGRSPEQYRQMLAVRAARTSAPAPVDGPQSMSLTQARAAAHPATLASRPPFGGFALADVSDAVCAVCDRIIPAPLNSSDHLRDVVLYVLHRFTIATLDELADWAGRGIEAVRTALAHVGVDRFLKPAWQRLLWAVEWTLRWRLRAAPHRP